MKKHVEIGCYAYKKDCEPDLMHAILNIFKCNSDYYSIEDRICYTRDGDALGVKMFIGGIDEYKNVGIMIRDIVEDFRNRFKDMNGLREGCNTIALIMCNGTINAINITVKPVDRPETTLFSD